MNDDTKRLDWLLAHDTMRVQGSDQRGWLVVDMNDGLVIVTRGHRTARDAIDAAMEIRP